MTRRLRLARYLCGRGDACRRPASSPPARVPVVRSVEGVGRNALQGDVRCDAAGLARIRFEDPCIIAEAPASGRLRAIDADMNHIPDAAMTLAVVALFAEGTTRLTNIGSWRVKETDRIADGDRIAQTGRL